MQATELIPGKVYRDTPEKDETSRYIEFVRYDFGYLIFKQVSPVCLYSQSDYLPEFFSDERFYELEPNETYDNHQ